MKAERLQIELTSKCNLKCSFCQRAFLPNLPIKDVDLSIFKKLDMGNMKYVDICGNVGEPTCHPNLLEFLDMISRGPNIKISTNGTLHQESWWKEVAKRMDYKKHSHIIFALDGLERSHCKYRVGTNYEKLLKNIEAFTSAGGNAYAQFILFKHNQDERDAIQKLANNLGCKGIIFRTSCGYDDIFERPDGVQTRHDACEDSNAQVSCDHIIKNMIFIDFEGEVFPCCPSANCKNEINKDKKYREMYHKYKKDINLYSKTLEEILSGEFFKFIHNNYKNLKVCKSFCKVDKMKFTKVTTNE